MRQPLLSGCQGGREVEGGSCYFFGALHDMGSLLVAILPTSACLNRFRKRVIANLASATKNTVEREASCRTPRRADRQVARVRVKIMIARLLEADARAEQNRKRPARAFGVDIAEALFDQPIHVRQPAHKAELRFGHQLEGS